MLERDKEYYNKKISELYAVIENQEKIIRDLQEEVKGYQTMYFDKVMIINKAIEYLHETSEIELGELSIYGDSINPHELEKILKGE